MVVIATGALCQQNTEELVFKHTCIHTDICTSMYVFAHTIQPCCKEMSKYKISLQAIWLLKAMMRSSSDIVFFFPVAIAFPLTSVDCLLYGPLPTLTLSQQALSQHFNLDHPSISSCIFPQTIKFSFTFARLERHAYNRGLCSYSILTFVSDSLVAQSPKQYKTF